uniref:Large ribosomal subunit protein bL32m n=1 Tax=Strigamia maritima TaxID=126957 RepID=T1J0N9_STRMM
MMLLRGKIILQSVLHRIQQQFTKVERIAVAVIGFRDYEPSLAFDAPQTLPESNSCEQSDSILGNGFVWGVPTSRRSLEKRMMRRLAPGKVYKLKGNIIVCPVCYSYHEAHTICGNCYAKVKAETTAMQEAIQKELKYDPIDKEVAVVYKGGRKPDNEGKRIVELDREPPVWFSKNLLTRAYMTREPPSKDLVASHSEPNFMPPI